MMTGGGRSATGTSQHIGCDGIDVLTVPNVVWNGQEVDLERPTIFESVFDSPGCANLSPSRNAMGEGSDWGRSLELQEEKYNSQLLTTQAP